MKKLVEITKIQSGYTFRSALSELPKGDVQVFQAKDIATPTNIQLPSVNVLNPRHLLQDGDILLAIRGSFNAKVIHTNGQKMVATSSVMIMRTNSNLITPQYLALYLNSPKGQDQLKSVATGGAIKSITKLELESLIIPIPEIHIQTYLTQLQSNIQKQIDLVGRKQQLIQSLLISATLQKVKQ